MLEHIYFLRFSISQILSSLSHVHLFSPHFWSTISLYFVLYFFSPHLNSLSSFIGSQFYLFPHLHLSQASYQLPIFFHAFSLASLFFKFFFSLLKCYNFGLVHSFCLAYRNFVRHAGSGWHRAVFGMIWNKGFLCTGLSTGVKNSGHSGCNGMVFKTLPTTTQNKGEKNSFGEKVGEFWCHQTFPLCIM